MFQSTRLRLRKMQNTDISLYHQWRNDHEVMASTSLVLDVYTYEETQSFVENVMLSSAQSKSYIIEELEHDTPIGVISLIGIDYKNRNAECILDIGEKKQMGQRVWHRSTFSLINIRVLRIKFTSIIVARLFNK